jgi:2-polyprenyl-3-methyl-5-hydroxy-6-metoxy-1,4-benzoquinol methylase
MNRVISKDSPRHIHEIAHGRVLAVQETELVWGWGSPAGQHRFARRANAIASEAAIQPGTKILELGCGTGLFTAVFAEKGADVTAVDISPDLLERAERRLGSYSNIRLVLGAFEVTNLDGPFDAIVGSSILHHLDVSESLNRIRELLKPGGYLCFAEPNYLNPQVFLERRLRYLPYFRRYVSPDETAFVRFSLARVLRSHGFADPQITPFDWLHPSTPRLLIRAVERLGAWLEQCPFLREAAGSLLIRARRT